MRLSGFVVASILLISANLLAQHSSGGGGSSSGGSHSSYSGSSSSWASSASSAGAGPSASYVGTSATLPAPSSSNSKSPSAKANASPEQKSSRSFFHPFRKLQRAEFKSAMPCLKGHCVPCPTGQARNVKGACVLASNACSSAQPWNGFTCGAQGWFNDCNVLAQRLAEQRRQMQSQSDYGQSLRYQLLQNQYQECLRRSHLPFGAYSFNNGLLLDTP